MDALKKGHTKVLLKATTLVETLVSLALIAIVLTIATTLFLNVLTTSTTQKRLLAKAIVGELFVEAKINSEWKSRRMQKNGLQIEWTVSPHPVIVDLLQVEFVARELTNGQVVYRQRNLVLKDDF